MDEGRMCSEEGVMIWARMRKTTFLEFDEKKETDT